MKVKTIIDVLSNLNPDLECEFVLESSNAKHFIDLFQVEEVQETQIKDTDMDGRPWEFEDLVERKPKVCRMVFNN